MRYMTVDKSTIEGISGGLDYFGVNITQVAAEKTLDREHITLNPVSEIPYLFKIQTSHSYLDCSKLRVISQWKLTKKGPSDTDFVPTKSEDNIGVANGFGAIWMRNVKVDLSGQEVFHSNNLYSYIAMAENELQFSEDTKKSSMNTFGYYYEERGKDKQVWMEGEEILSHSGRSLKPDEENETPSAGGTTTTTTPAPKKAKPAGKVHTTPSWNKRRDLFTDGKIVEFSAPLYVDLFQQPLFLPSNMEINIEIYPQDKQFMVHAPYFEGEIKLDLIAVRLLCSYVDLHPGIALEIEKRLESEPARIPIRRIQAKALFYDHERMNAHSTIFMDQVPRQMTVFFVPKKNYNGTFQTDGFYCDYHDLNHIQVRAGNTIIPNVQWDIDHKYGRYMRPFAHLHNTLGPAGRNVDCGINLDMYYDGYTIYPFNMTTTQEDDEGFDFIRDAPTIVDLKWNKEIKKGGIMGIYIGKFDSMMFIDKTRTVRTDLTI